MAQCACISGRNTSEPVFSFHYVGPVIKLGIKCLYLLSHLISLDLETLFFISTQSIMYDLCTKTNKTHYGSIRKLYKQQTHLYWNMIIFLNLAKPTHDLGLFIILVAM